MALLVEYEDCRGKDGEEEEDEDYEGALGTDLLDGHRGRLEGCEGTPEAGLFITCLGFLEEFLMVGQVDTGLAGTVVGDEILNWETALPTQNLGEPIL